MPTFLRSREDHLDTSDVASGVDYSLFDAYSSEGCSHIMMWNASVPGPQEVGPAPALNDHYGKTNQLNFSAFSTDYNFSQAPVTAGTPVWTSQHPISAGQEHYTHLGSSQAPVSSNLHQSHKSQGYGSPSASEESLATLQDSTNLYETSTTFSGGLGNGFVAWPPFDERATSKQFHDSMAVVPGAPHGLTFGYPTTTHHHLNHISADPTLSRKDTCPFHQPENAIGMPSSTSVQHFEELQYPPSLSHTPVASLETQRFSVPSGRPKASSPDRSESAHPSMDEVIEEDGDTDIIRKGPFYNVEPHPDGLYYCPFKAQDGCMHTPTKLKCNYDKYVDSHLKPHRCKAPECKGLRFSSTACRLRHERESHGSHGHGVKPYLCTYEGCDRAQEGNGFPRSWNRNDHMKRCHNHIVTAKDEEEPASPVLTAPRSEPSEKKAPASRKRKATEVPQVEPQKKVKQAPTISQVNNDASAKQDLSEQQAIQNLYVKYQQLFNMVHDQMHMLTQPWDTAALDRLHEGTGQLKDISHRMSALLRSQVQRPTVQ